MYPNNSKSLYPLCNEYLHQQCCSVQLFSDLRLGKGGDEDKSTFAAASLPINSCR